MFSQTNHAKWEIKKITNTVNQIESMRSDMLAMSDDELKQETERMKKLVQNNAESLIICFPAHLRFSGKLPEE